MGEIKNASEATERALAFLSRESPIRGKVAKPLKAARKDNLWIVKFNVGIVKVIMATIKIDASTGEVMEYEIPPIPKLSEIR